MNSLKTGLLSSLVLSFVIYQGLVFPYNLQNTKPDGENNCGPVRPIDIFTDPSLLTKLKFQSPITLSCYSEKERVIQELINKQTANAITTFSPTNQCNNWIELDYEEITPFSWRWVDLELVQPIHKTISKISLRRPNWWIEKVGADSVGRKVYIDMPELGCQGWARTTGLRVNQLDTRFWDENRNGDYVSRPITGKFEHLSKDVYNLFFQEKKPLSVTGSHPIWSLNANSWVNARDLRIGEAVKTQNDKTILSRIEKLSGSQVVYNLEIYRDHNYLVSTDRILVHNNCLPKISVIANDWVTKGAHIHYGNIELAVRPNGSGGIMFQKVFSSTTDADFRSAVKLAKKALEDKTWLRKFRHSVKEARDYMHGVHGALSELANGRAAELNFLLIAIDNLI